MKNASTATVSPALLHRAARRLKMRPLSVVIAGTLAMLAAQGALAQVQAPASQDDASRPSDNMTQLDVTYVTANKRQEDVRKVAASVTVINAEQLENTHYVQLTDLQGTVPGLNLSSDGPSGRSTISLRGISPLSSGATVGTYLDETPLGSSGLYQGANVFSLDLLPYDIKSIEVLRGPQGTLYGAGSMGGLLKYVTVEPDTVSREFQVGGGLSSVDGSGDLGWDTRFGANLPLIANELALRVSYTRNELPGFIDNSATGEKDTNGGSQSSTRAALLWQNDSMKLNVTAMRQTTDSDNNAQVALDPVTQQPLFGNMSRDINYNEPYTKDLNFYSATFDWNLGWGNFTSATSYSETTTKSRLDTTIQYGQFTNLGLGLPDPGSSYFDVGLDLDKFSQEFRLASDSTGPFQWMVGYFYTRETGTQTQFVALNQADGSPLPPPLDEVAGTLAALAIPSRYKENAFFANGSYAFNELFKLNAGIRYAENDQTFSQNVTSGLLLPIGQSPGASSEGVWTWSLSPQFQLSDNSMLYARVATGYQPGGPNVVAPGLPPTVNSSTLTSYEVGLKSQFYDNRLTFDVTGFNIDWQHIQVATVFNGVSGLVNGGTANSKGVELSSEFKVTDHFRLGLNAAYTNARLTQAYPTISISSPPYLVDIISGQKGDSLPYVPRWSGSATGDYFIPIGNSWTAHFGGAYRWIGSRVSGTTEIQNTYDATMTPPTLLVSAVTPSLKLKSYGQLDINAYVANDSWTVRGYVKNVTNTKGYLSINPVANALTKETVELVGALITPRTIGVEVDYRF